MSLEVTNGVQAHCTLLKQFTYELIWRPEKHWAPGTQIELRCGRLRSLHMWRWVRSEVRGADVTWRWKVQPPPGGVWHNPERVILRATLPYGVRQGQAVPICLTARPPSSAGIDAALSLWTTEVSNAFDPDEGELVPQAEEGSECTLNVLAGPVERLAVYSHPAPGSDGKVRTCIVPEDRFGNPAMFDNPVTIALNWNGKCQQEQLRQTRIVSLEAPEGVGRCIASVPMSALSPRENITNGVRQGNALAVTGNPVWPEGIDGLQPAFGEIHWHTDISGDGQRSIDEALRCARDELNLNFAAPGDHNPQRERWEQTVAAVDAANDSDAFATFFGWENGTNRGHENYYFTTPDHPLVCGGSAGIVSAKPYEISEQLREFRDFIAIPHHTNAVSEMRPDGNLPFWPQYDWMAPEGYRRLIEIMQTRGNQERNVYDDAWRGWHQNWNASAQDALALGHKLGFTGGTDNHCGWPGRCEIEPGEGLGRHPNNSQILTGVWAKRIERQAVFDALYARHTWAVWDTRALVHYSVNGALGGEEITVEKGIDLTAHIRLSAQEALQTVEIVSEAQVVWQSSFEELDVDVNVPLGPAEASTHFYLRALQRDGGIIYASPVFVNVT